MIKEITATGKDVNVAKENAIAALGARPEDDVKFEVLDLGTKGIFGIGARPATVRAYIELPDPVERRRPQSSEEGAVITLPLYYTPVSAGPGATLEGADHETIEVRASYTTEQADFALRVSGNSMEPRFKNGDIVLVHQQSTVLFGELGIFVADGKGYFKRFMGDRLHSLNPEYPDIPLRRFDDFFCCGKVVGHMKKKS